MPLGGNPFAVLTLISAPAVLTNASCVLLFGTGNRYGRAVDRVHELAELIRAKSGLSQQEFALRSRQLDAGEMRALLIVRALTSFYTAVAGFVASTLVSLIGALLAGTAFRIATDPCFCVALAAGVTGVVAMMTGALLLAREPRYSFAVLKEERAYLQTQVHDRPDRALSEGRERA